MLSLKIIIAFVTRIQLTVTLSEWSGQSTQSFIETTYIKNHTARANSIWFYAVLIQCCQAKLRSKTAVSVSVIVMSLRCSSEAVFLQQRRPTATGYATSTQIHAVTLLSSSADASCTRQRNESYSGGGGDWDKELQKTLQSQ